MLKTKVLAQALMTASLSSFLVAGCGNQTQSNRLKSKTEELDKTNATLIKSTEHMKQTIQGLHQSIDGLNTTLEGIKKSDTSTDGQIQKIDSTLSKLEQSITKNGDSLNGIQSELVSSNGHLTDSKAKLDAVHTQILTTNGKLDEGIQKQAALIEKVGSVDGKLVGLGEQLGRIDATTKEFLVKLDGLDGKLGNVGDQITAINGSLKELGQQLGAQAESAIKRADENTAALSAQVNDMNQTVTPRVTKAARKDSWAKLTSKDLSLAQQIPEAETLLKSFDYQTKIATNDAELAVRLQLQNEAVKEFIVRLRSLLPKEKKYNSWTALTDAPNESIEALAAELDAKTTVSGKTNPSLLEMITESLILGATSSEAEAKEWPEYVTTILHEKEWATWILRIRVQTLVKLAMAQVTKVTQRSMGVYGLFKPYELKISTNPKDLSVLEEIKNYLTKASEDKQTLMTIGEIVRPGMRLRQALMSMRLDSEGITDANLQHSVEAIIESRRKILSEKPLSNSVSTSADTATGDSAAVYGDSVQTSKDATDAPITNGAQAPDSSAPRTSEPSTGGSSQTATSEGNSSKADPSI